MKINSIMLIISNFKTNETSLLTICSVHYLHAHTDLHMHKYLGGEKHKDPCRFVPDSDLQLVFSAEIVPQLAILFLRGFLST